MNKHELIEQFIKSREYEASPMLGAFGYGSGVFRQEGNNASVIDLIFVVDSAREWHQANMASNPNDYSLTGRIMLKTFDLNTVSALTGVTYQHNIPFDGAKFKYGVVNQRTLIRNLKLWDRFFLPGRFQKPIKIIKSNPVIDYAINSNREAALIASLLCMPKGDITLKDLYTKICSLSYRGDIRMLFAENPNKIKNIVESNFEELRQIYGTSNQYFNTDDNGYIHIHYSELWAAITDLPDSLYDYLLSHNYLNQPLDALKTDIEKYIASINRRDSLAQPVTGILTIGPIASIGYLGQKIKKRFK